MYMSGRGVFIGEEYVYGGEVCLCGGGVFYKC